MGWMEELINQENEDDPDTGTSKKLANAIREEIRKKAKEFKMTKCIPGNSDWANGVDHFLIDGLGISDKGGEGK